MKGLLLKDLYVTWKQGRIYILLTVVFLIISFFANNNLFMIAYPCLVFCMLPVNLLAYDEREKWDAYSATLPYSRAHIVSVKYIIGLLLQLTTLCVIAGIQAARMIYYGVFCLDDYVVLMELLVALSFTATAISLPFMFKLGVEKGRMAYYFTFGIIGAGSAIASNTLQSQISGHVSHMRSQAAISLIAVVLYVGSWYLSIHFYKQRDL